MELNKTYNENCLDTMARMPNEFVDLTVTSPPYADLRDYEGFTFEFEKVAKELYRITKQGGVLVWIVGDKRKNHDLQGIPFEQVLYFKEVGFLLRQSMIWDKGGVNFPHSNYYHRVHEHMFILTKGIPNTVNLIKDRTNKSKGQKYSGKKRQKDNTFKKMKSESLRKPKMGFRFNIWTYFTGSTNSSKDKIAFEHPAIFPEKLAYDHIRSWTKENDLIYDPFMGSGTTAKMAIELKRNWIGSEVSKQYCNIISQRLAEFKKEKDGLLFW